jgi:hypothetical protein
VKKTSGKARRQRDDRAYAEFEAVMRKLAKTTTARDVEAERAEPEGEVPRRLAHGSP